MRETDQPDENTGASSPRSAFDRRRFLRGAAGAVTAAGSLGLAPLVGAPSLGSSSRLGPGKVIAVSPGLQTGSLSNLSHYISIRHTGPFQDVNTTWARLTQFALANNLSGSNLVTFAAACPCGDINAEIAGVEPGDLQYDACLAVTAAQHSQITQTLASKPGSNYAGVKTGTVSVGTTMMIVHQGPYSLLGETYRAALEAGATLFTSVSGSGQSVAIEVYRNNPLLTKPADLITEIHFSSGSGHTATGPLFS